MESIRETIQTARDAFAALIITAAWIRIIFCWALAGTSGVYTITLVEGFLDSDWLPFRIVNKVMFPWGAFVLVLMAIPSLVLNFFFPLTFR